MADCRNWHDNCRPLDLLAANPAHSSSCTCQRPLSSCHRLIGHQHHARYYANVKLLQDQRRRRRAAAAEEKSISRCLNSFHSIRAHRNDYLAGQTRRVFVNHNTKSPPANHFRPRARQEHLAHCADSDYAASSPHNVTKLPSTVYPPAGSGARRSRPLPSINRSQSAIWRRFQSTSTLVCFFITFLASLLGHPPLSPPRALIQQPNCLHYHAEQLLLSTSSSASFLSTLSGYSSWISILPQASASPGNEARG